MIKMNEENKRKLGWQALHHVFAYGKNIRSFVNTSHVEKYYPYDLRIFFFNIFEQR